MTCGPCAPRYFLHHEMSRPLQEPHVNHSDGVADGEVKQCTPLVQWYMDLGSCAFLPLYVRALPS